MMKEDRKFRTASRVFGVLIMALLLCAGFMMAQENAGQINGTVTDQTGAVVPGAKVVVTSPQLPKGLETISDAQGRYVLPRVPLGTYTMTVTKQGFTAVRQYGIAISLGSQFNYNPRMSVGSVAETIEVTEAALSLDTTSSRTSTNISASQFDGLAKGRDYVSLLAIAPGVRMENKGGGANIQVDGASTSENAYVIDGVDTTDMFTGDLRNAFRLPTQLIQEVQVKSGGFEAEFGGANGGVINIATKSGTNAFHGSAELQFRNDQMNPRPRGYWQRSAASADIGELFAPKKDTWREMWPGGTIGGPILKDRLFFLESYMPTLTRTERIKAYPTGERQYRNETIQHYSLSRVDYNPTQKVQINTSWIWSPYRNKGLLPSTDIRLPAPTNDQSIGGGFTPAQSYTASGTYSATSRLLIQARYGYKYLNNKGNTYGIGSAPYIRYLEATTNAAGVPAGLAGPNGFSNISSPFQVIRDIQERQNIYVDASYLANFAGQHTFKFGYAINKMMNDINDDYPNGRFDIYWGDAFSRGSYNKVQGQYGYYIWEDGTRHNAKVQGHNQGFYFQDSWRPAKNVTINAGLRFENEFLPPYKAEQNGIKIANPISFGWGSKIAPRLGAAWDLKGDGRWKISGSFASFFDVMKYDIARSSFGGEFWFSNVYKIDNPNNLYSLSKATPGAMGDKILTYDNRTIPINAKGELEGIDPNIKPFQSRQITAALDHQLTSKVTFGVRYTHNWVLKGIEDIGVLDSEDNEVYLIGNPGFGDTRNTKSVFGQKTPNGKEFLVPVATRKYDGLEFRVQGKVLNNLNLMGSYTYSRLWGNWSGLANTDESGRQNPGVSRAFDLPYYYFDASGDQKNKFGRLATDRPNTFKLFGNYDLKSRAGVTNFGLTQIAMSGTPDSTSVIYLSAPTFPNGRGDMGRTPFYTQTDMTVSHVVKTGERTSLKFEVQVLNVMNQAAVIARGSQINRSSAITAAALPLDKFFAGYKLSNFVYPGSKTPPYNPIYNMPTGDYRNGGTGGYQGPRNLRLGVSFIF